VQPPHDREMDLREHLAELRVRVINSLIPFVILTAIVFVKSDEIISILWDNLFKGREMVVYTPPEFMLSRLLVSLFIAFIFTYPWIIYQAYLFVKPALYPHEEKFLKMYLPLSYLSFLIGAFLAYELILPLIYSSVVVEYLGAEPFLSVKESLYNVVKIIILIGVFSQMPLILTIAVRFKLISTKSLREKRLIIYLLIFILLTNISFDISGLTQLVILIAFVISFELSILIARIFEGRRDEDHYSGSRGSGI